MQLILSVLGVIIILGILTFIYLVGATADWLDRITSE